MKDFFAKAIAEMEILTDEEFVATVSRMGYTVMQKKQNCSFYNVSTSHFKSSSASFQVNTEALDTLPTAA